MVLSCLLGVERTGDSGLCVPNDDGADSDEDVFFRSSSVDVGVSAGGCAASVAIIFRFGSIRIGTSGCLLFRWRVKFPVDPPATLTLSLQ